MHEYSIVRALMDRVETEARTRRALRVRRLSVSVGALAGIDVSLLRTAYDVCRPGTVCETARLDVTGVPARWQCSRCARDVEGGGPLRCSICQAPARLAAGGDILLDRIELEVPDV
jgi:hydrogenase nickel incorporation protein HypA/HybF